MVLGWSWGNPGVFLGWSWGGPGVVLGVVLRVVLGWSWVVLESKNIASPNLCQFLLKRALESVRFCCSAREDPF